MITCSICRVAKSNVTEYRILSVTENHTFWALDMCIECRDKILASIAKRKRKEA